MTFAEFRRQFPKASYPIYEFDQMKMLEASDGKDPDSDAVMMQVKPGRAVDIHEGVCIQASKMWIQARNYPAMVSDEDARRSPLQPIMGFIRRHWETIMCSQALHQSGLSHGRISGKDREIAGLAKPEEFSVGKLWGHSMATSYYQQLTAANVMFAILDIIKPEGSHAIGFDVRAGGFAFFDPNVGMLVANNGAGDDTRKLFKAWLEFCNAEPNSLTTYSRN